MTIKFKVLQVAAASALAFAAIATVGASSASASPQWVPWYSCTHGGHPGLCTAIKSRATLWESNNTVNRILNADDQVEVECWYTGGGPGTPKDGVWDHIVWTGPLLDPQAPGSLVLGHVDDDFVDFTGLIPGKQIVLPHCG